MEFRLLRAFGEVVRQGGFSQSAPVLLTTQSSVSAVVKQLEDEPGGPLLSRIAVFGQIGSATCRGHVLRCVAK